MNDYTLKIEIETVQCSVLFYFTLYVTSGYSIFSPEILQEGGDFKPLTLSPSSLYSSWKGTRKNLRMTLFEKSRGQSLMSWSIWLVPSLVWVGEVWSKHGLKWLQESAFTCWRPISPLCFLRNAAIGSKWVKLTPFIFLLFFLTSQLYDLCVAWTSAFKQFFLQHL